MYVIQGFQIATSEQARTLLLVVMLEGNQSAAAEVHAALKQLEAEGK